VPRIHPRSIAAVLHTDGVDDISVRDLTRIASSLSVAMPESQEGELLYRAKVLVGFGHGIEESLHEFLMLAIYHLSNNTFHPRSDTWEHVMSVLQQSGLMKRILEARLFALDSTTGRAAMEKLFQIAVLRATVSNDGVAQSVLVWLLGCGQNPDVPIQTSYRIFQTAVQLSTVAGQIDILRILLNHGANPNKTTTTHCQSPLELALVEPEHYVKLPTSAQRVEMALLLISNGAEVGVHVGARAMSFLNLAIQFGNISLVDKVLSHLKHEDITVRMFSWHGSVHEVTPLTQAAGFLGEDLNDEGRNHKALGLVRYIKGILDSTPAHESAFSAHTWVTTDVFIAAAAAGNYRVIRYLHDFNPPAASSANSRGVTPLHAAARSKCRVTCEVLLEYGHPVDPPSRYPPPLHIASALGTPDIVKLLISNGAKTSQQIRISEEDFEEMFEEKFLPQRPGYMLYLREEGVPEFVFMRTMRQEGLSPLRLSIAFGNDDCALALLERGAEVSAGDFKVAAALLVDINILQAMLDAVTGQQGHASASLTPHEALCEILGVLGDDPHGCVSRVAGWICCAHHQPFPFVSDREGFYRGEFQKTLKTILDRFPDAFEVGTTEWRRLANAALYSQTDEIIREVAAKLDPGLLCAAIVSEASELLIRDIICLRDSRGPEEKLDLLEVTAIGLAAWRPGGERVCLPMLLDAFGLSEGSAKISKCILPYHYSENRAWGHDVRELGIRTSFWNYAPERTMQGSPLVFAVEAGNFKSFMQLLESGFEPDWLTWYTLAKNKENAMAKVLLEKGKKMTPFDRAPSYTHQPLVRAARAENVEMVRLLLEAGFPTKFSDVTFDQDESRPQTTFQAAIWSGNLEIIRLLLDAGADVNETCGPRWGITPLQCAAAAGHTGLVGELVRRHADINAQPASYRGKTALEHAAEGGKLEIVKFLLDKGANTTGEYRRRFIRAYMLAENAGHEVVKGILKEHSNGWTDDDISVMNDPCVLDRPVCECDSTTSSGSQAGASGGEGVGSLGGDDDAVREDLHADLEGNYLKEYQDTMATSLWPGDGGLIEDQLYDLGYVGGTLTHASGWIEEEISWETDGVSGGMPTDVDFGRGDPMFDDAIFNDSTLDDAIFNDLMFQDAVHGSFAADQMDLTAD